MRDINEIENENALLKRKACELQEKYELRVSELSMLHELFMSISYINDFRKICENILNIIIKNTSARECAVMFLDRKKNCLFLICATNYIDSTYITEPKKILARDNVLYLPKALESAAGEALLGKKTFLVEDTEKSSLFNKDEYIHKDIKSLLSVPLILDGKAMGVMNLGHQDPGAFSQDDIHLFRVVSDYTIASLYSALNYEKLKDREDKYRALVENSNNGIAIIQNDYHIYTNPRYRELTGYSDEELKNLEFEKIINNPYQIIDLPRILTSLKGSSDNEVFTAQIVKKSGGVMDVEISVSSVLHNGKRNLILSMLDITERKILERQLIHAQKMQSMGTLAGGIAHNFNNLLMGIQGNTSIALLEMDERHPHYKNLTNIEKLVKNGSNLTNQLLGYAREGKFEIKPINLNLIVKETSETFGAARKDIRIILDLAANLFGVKADQGQIEQTLLNLFVNAADAMPEGGTLTVKTENVTEQELLNKPYKPKAGNYVLTSVKDTGLGIDPKIIDRVFEPFFTTKGLARGTGLGLASAYGIIKGHGGYIDVSSIKGKETTFSIYLPSTNESINKDIDLPDELYMGTGDILLVDDEDIIIYAGEHMLKRLGYNVIVAKSGQEAVDIYKTKAENIDLVLLDMVMPGMNGGETYGHLKKLDPGVKVLLSSGYSLDGHATEIMEQGCNGFIQKPFTIKSLSQKLREILGNKGE